MVLTHTFMIPIALSLLFAGCNQNTKPPITQHQEPSQLEQSRMIGNDMDANGCKPSTGYTWSKAKNSCIRIFEEGFAFTNYDASQDEASKKRLPNIYVVLSNDQKKAEIFWGTKESTLLESQPVYEYDIQSNLYKNKKENIVITLERDGFWIRQNHEPLYYQYFSDTEGMGAKYKLKFTKQP